MAPRSKKQDDKHPRESSPELEHIEFVIPKHQACFARLGKLKFRQTRFTNVDALREVQKGDDIVDEIEEMLSVGSWRWLLSIRELAIRMLTLEVLVSLEFDRSYS